MNFQELMNDKGIKPKMKIEALSTWVLENTDKINELIDYAETSRDTIKASFIEALEFATKTNPNIATPACLEFVSKTLAEKAPRIKWESARVVANIAPLFPDKLDDAIHNLLLNSEHTGTVVRWSTAFALSQILKMKTSRNKDLIAAVEAIYKMEEKNSIKKIYLEALKKL